MQYPVVVVRSEDGFAVSCPALPGCHSKGKTHKEALENIREAIALWLEVAEEDVRYDEALRASLLAATAKPTRSYRSGEFLELARRAIQEEELPASDEQLRPRAL